MDVGGQTREFSELARFIDDNHVLLGSFQTSSKVSVGPLRIYVLKDRLKEFTFAAADANAADYGILRRGNKPAGCRQSLLF